MPDNVELVRRLWTAFERGGIEAVLEVADPDVTWEPYGGGGVVYRGHDGLREYMEGRRERDEEADGRLYSAFAKGDAVVARGEVRIKGPHGIVTMQPGWLYEFHDGKLIRFRGFPTQEAALRAAGLAPQDREAIVREVWAAANRKDIEGIVSLTADDVEWHTYTGSRPVYRGHDGLREYWHESYDAIETINVTEYAFREVADAVAMSGSLHTVDPRGGVVQRQIHYVFWIPEAKIVKAQSFPRRQDAMAAAGASTQAPPG